MISLPCIALYMSNYPGESLIGYQCLYVIPAQAGIQENQPPGLLAALALPANLRLFNALRAFVRFWLEWRVDRRLPGWRLTVPCRNLQGRAAAGVKAGLRKRFGDERLLQW